MKSIKCGHCSFEIEHGARVCQGCQGVVTYGPGGIGLFFGGCYAIAVLQISLYIDIGGSWSGWWLLIPFFAGVIHAGHLFKDRISISRRE